jgi:hypothetical protein
MDKFVIRRRRDQSNETPPNVSDNNSVAGTSSQQIDLDAIANRAMAASFDQEPLIEKELKNKADNRRFIPEWGEKFPWINYRPGV